MTLPWPSLYDGIKNTLYSNWNVRDDIRIFREFSEGKSKAKVFQVDLICKKYNGLAILKLDTPTRWSDSEKSEYERHIIAETKSSDFAKEHLSKPIAYYEHGGQTALLCSIAGESLLYVLPLFRLDTGQQSNAIQLVSQGILEEWNKDYVVSPPCKPCEALDSWLGYRINPALGGKIDGFLSENCQLNPIVNSFSFLGQWFPNPYAYSSQKSLWPIEHDLMMVKGQVHNDLHGYNILIKISGKTKLSYYIIDFALYEEINYLFYDHAYLELSTLLHDRENLSYNRWIQLLEALRGTHAKQVKSGELHPDDLGVISIVKLIRKELWRWIDKYEPKRKEHMEGQILLAKVAAGLNFVNKELDDKQRILAFLFAAKYLREYLDAFQLKWKAEGPTLNISDPVEAPLSKDWKKVWDFCDRFDKDKNCYILVSGPDVRKINRTDLQVLGKIPWSIAFDFDPNSKKGGIQDAIRSTIMKYRAIHETVSPNMQEINYREATEWFMAGGSITREGTIKTDFDEWRRFYLQSIQISVNKLRNSISPLPIVVLILIDGINPQYLRALWERIDEVLGAEARYAVIHEDGINLSEIDKKVGVTVLHCSLQNLLSGLWNVYGTDKDEEEIKIPARASRDKERNYISLNDEELQYLKEDLELVHVGLIEKPVPGKLIGYDFWRGNEITWSELDMGADVPRIISNGLKSEIKSKLDESWNYTIPVYHMPGSGGTTLGKRIAWDFKEFYPTVLIRHISPNTVSRIEMLFHKTGLPVFVVMEAALVPPPIRENLYRNLKGRNVRSVFLYISRSMAPKGEFIIDCPIDKVEANRFYGRYKDISTPQREPMLRKLSYSDEMIAYRSPFFYGLYSFEKEFVHVPDFVSANLENLSDESRKIILYLSLITAFSQESLRDIIIKKHFNLSADKPFIINQILGNGPDSLLISQGNKLRVIHPIIAKEILKQQSELQSLKKGIYWEDSLIDLSCDFIDFLLDTCDVVAEEEIKILRQLFISREYWQGVRDRRRHFSELILTIKSEPGQHKVLKKLTECFPEDPHFWNHLGRHHIYVMRSTYTEAEACLNRAIELEGWNEIHYHALGMIYRYEIRNFLDKCIKDQVSSEDALIKISNLIENAEGCFAKCREIAPETNYGYITNIQLVTEIITRLFKLSGFDDYRQLLTDTGLVGSWCREKIPQAEDLLRKAKNLQVEERLSNLTVKCQSDILKIYGQYDTLIKSLVELMQRKDLYQPSIRRMIANAFHANKNYSWHNMTEKELLSVSTLMSKNLEDEPANSRDLLMWFNSIRRIKTFDMIDAIDLLTRWANREESIEAYYYLYILHFLRWKQMILKESKIVRKFMDKCEDLSGKLGRVFCYEWLAKEPRWCPIINHTELGKWDHKLRFYNKIERLDRVTGEILHIEGPQSGLIAYGPFKIFFRPGAEFFPGKDEGKEVTFFLGFSYDGLRGYKAIPVSK